MKTLPRALLLSAALSTSACGDTVETEEDPDAKDCYDPCIDKGGTDEECSAYCDGDKGDTARCVADCTEKGESEEVCTEYCEGGKKSGDLSTYEFEHDGLTRHYLYAARRATSAS